MKKIVIAVVLLLFVGVGIRQYIMYRVAPDMDLSKLHLVDMQGNPVDVSVYKGKTIFVNFFATWCGPCNREMPELELMKQTLKNENIVFLAVSDESPALIQNYAHKWSSSFTFLRTVEKRKEYGINTIPTTYVISPKGKLLYNIIGTENWNNAEVVDKIRKMTLEETAPAP